MADQKISELTALTGANAADDDVLAIVDTSAVETKKITRSELFKDTPSIGIGTSSPSALAHVYNGMLQVGSKTGDTSIQQNTNAIRISAVPNSTTEWGGLQWYREFSDVIGAEIIASRPSSAETDTDLIFKTSTNSSNAVEAMRLDSSGNVGIGTSSPTATLDVSGAIRSTDRISGDGTEAAPAFRFTTDTNTGMFPPAGGDIIGFSTGASEAMRIDSSGNLLVGKTAGVSGAYLQLGGSSSKQSLRMENSYGSGGNTVCLINNQTNATFTAFNFENGGANKGSISVTTTATAYNTSSDYRLKENIVELTGATTRLKQLEPKRFNFIADADTTVDGFIAHEVQSVVPEAITGTHNEVDDDGNPVYQGIDQSKLVPLLVATIQELEARITALENA